MKKLFSIMAGIVILSMIMGTGTYAANSTETKIVACVGDSLTESEYNGSWGIYPAELQRLLGSNFKVSNYGISGTTMSTSSSGYIGTAKYNNSLNTPPDYVVIMFGTNDTHFFDFEDDEVREYYKKNYKRMIDAYRQLNTKVKIIMLAPPPLNTEMEEMIQRDTEIRELVVPIVKDLSQKYGCEYIDMYATINSAHPDGGVWQDSTHFNTEGYHTIAKAVYDKIISIDESKKVTADFVADTVVSTISKSAFAANVFIAAYDKKGLIDVIDAGNIEVAKEASTMIDTEELEKAGATEICMYVWSPDGKLSPITEKVPVGIRCEVGDDGITIKGTSLVALGNKHGILVKNAAGELVWASEQVVGESLKYSYTVKLASGTYTVYTGTGGNAVVETLTIE